MAPSSTDTRPSSREPDLERWGNCPLRGRVWRLRGDPFFRKIPALALSGSIREHASMEGEGLTPTLTLPFQGEGGEAVNSRPPLPAATRIVSPGRKSPSSNLSANGSCSSRWMARLSGRAP